MDPRAQEVREVRRARWMNENAPATVVETSSDWRSNALGKTHLSASLAATVR